MSVQKENHPSVKVCVVGVSGTGKTTLFESLVRRARARWLFLYDHKDGDLARRWQVPACNTPDDLLDAIEAGRRVLIFNPHEMFPGSDPADGFDFFCKFVWEVGRLMRGVKIIGADELDAICDERSKPKELCKILNMGRTFQFDGYFIAQSMNGVHNQVRKQITEIFAFRQGDANGLEWLKQKGFDGQELETIKNGIWKYKNLTTGAAASGGKEFEPKGACRDLRGL